MDSQAPRPAAAWQLRTRTLAVGRIPLLMGIVNATPDSFSDAGQCFDPAAAIARGLQLAADGADLLDVGGESTRPGAQPVDAGEELRRVMPVVAALCQQTSLPVSIDTTKAIVAREALAAGAEAINDVTGLTGDAGMLPLAVDAGCGLCVMHMRGMPQTMQQNPVYGDVVAEVHAYLAQRRDAIVAAGLRQAHVALDPGIGFGKTTAHNLALLSHAWQLHAFGCPIVVGHSRKRFIGELLGDLRADRTSGTIGVALAMAAQQVQVLRVHDVAAVRQSLLLYEATRRREEIDPESFA